MRYSLIALLAILLCPPLFGQTNGFRQMNGIYLVPQASSLALQGDDRIYMLTNDTIAVEFGGIRYKLLLSGAVDGETFVYNAAQKLYAPGTPAGGGGSAAINDLLDATSAGTIDLLTYPLTIASGTTAGNVPSWSFTGSSSSHTGHLVRLNTSDVNSTTKPIGIFARGTTNGVEMSSTGALSYTGTGSISANLWKGAATIDKASQHAQTAYKDQQNTFTAAQTITMNTPEAGLTISQTGANRALTISSTYASQPTGYIYNTGIGTGLKTGSFMGYGLVANSYQGVPASFSYNDVRVLDIGGASMYPAVASVYSLGNVALPFKSLWADSVFVLGTKWAPTKGGKAYFDAAGQVWISGLGTDSTWVVQVTLGGDPGQPITYYATLDDMGNLFIYSLTEEVEGIAVYYTITKRTDL